MTSKGIRFLGDCFGGFLRRRLDVEYLRSRWGRKLAYFRSKSYLNGIFSRKIEVHVIEHRPLFFCERQPFAQDGLCPFVIKDNALRDASKASSTCKLGAYCGLVDHKGRTFGSLARFSPKIGDAGDGLDRPDIIERQVNREGSQAACEKRIRIRHEKQHRGTRPPEKIQLGKTGKMPTSILPPNKVLTIHFVVPTTQVLIDFESSNFADIYFLNDVENGLFQTGKRDFPYTYKNQTQYFQKLKFPWPTGEKWHLLIGNPSHTENIAIHYRVFDVP